LGARATPDTAVVKDEKNHLHLLCYCLPSETISAAAGVVVGLPGANASHLLRQFRDSTGRVAERLAEALD